MNILEEQKRLAKEYESRVRDLENEYGNRILSLVDDKFVVIKTLNNKSNKEISIIDYVIKLPSIYCGVPCLNSMISDLTLTLHCDVGFKETSSITVSCHDHKADGYLDILDFDNYKFERNKEVYFIQRTPDALRKELTRIATKDDISIFSILCSGPADILEDIVPDTAYPNFTITAGIQVATRDREKEFGIISSVSNAKDITDDVKDNPYYIIDYIVSRVERVLERLKGYKEGE